MLSRHDYAGLVTAMNKTPAVVKVFLDVVTNTSEPDELHKQLSGLCEGLKGQQRTARLASKTLASTQRLERWAVLHEILASKNPQLLRSFLEANRDADFRAELMAHYSEVVDALASAEYDIHCAFIEKVRPEALADLFQLCVDKRDTARFKVLSEAERSAKGPVTWKTRHRKLIAEQTAQNHLKKLITDNPELLTQELSQLSDRAFLKAGLGSSLESLFSLAELQALSPSSERALIELIELAKGAAYEPSYDWWCSHDMRGELTRGSSEQLEAYFRLCPETYRYGAVTSILSLAKDEHITNCFSKLQAAFSPDQWTELWQPSSYGSLLRYGVANRASWEDGLAACPPDLLSQQWVSDSEETPTLIDTVIRSDRDGRADLAMLWDSAPLEVRERFLGPDAQGRTAMTRRSTMHNDRWLRVIEPKLSPPQREKLWQPDAHGHHLLHQAALDGDTSFVMSFMYRLDKERLDAMWEPLPDGTTPATLLLQKGESIGDACRVIPEGADKAWLSLFSFVMQKEQSAANLEKLIDRLMWSQPETSLLALDVCNDELRPTVISLLISSFVTSGSETLLETLHAQCDEKEWMQAWLDGNALYTAASKNKSNEEVWELFCSFCPPEAIERQWEATEQRLGLLDQICRDHYIDDLAFWLPRAPSGVLERFFNDADGQTPLHRHAAHTDEWQLAVLRDSVGKERFDQMWRPDHQGRSPLMTALLPADGPLPDWRLCRDPASLLSFCPPERFEQQWQPDKQGLSVLAHAARSQVELDFGQLLELCPEELREQQWQRDSQGMTVLHHYIAAALQTGDFEQVDTICPYDKREQMLNSIDPKTGQSALHLLVSLINDSMILEPLVLACPQELLAHRDHNGLRAVDLYIACGDSFEVLDLLDPDFDHHDESLQDFVAAASQGDQIARPLARHVYRRLCERHPAFPRGTLSLPNAAPFVEHLLGKEGPEKDRATELLRYTYAMNQSLPCTIEGFGEVEALFERFPDQHTEIYLALQTGADLPDTARALAARRLEEASFSSLSDADKADYLCRAQVLRKRSGLAAARMALKSETPDQELLLQALRVFERTEIDPQGKTRSRIYALIKDQDPGLDGLRVQAMRAASAILSDPYDPEHKQVLLDALKAGNHAAIQELAKCSYNMESALDTDILTATLSLVSASTVEQVELRCQCAFLLACMPDELALVAAARIVNGPDWDHFEAGNTKMESIGRVGHYLIYPYQPLYERNRMRAQQMIAERYLSIHRGKLAEQIQQHLAKFRDDPHAMPKLLSVEKAVRSVQESARAVPLPIFFPAGKTLFRGVNARKGEDLHAAVLDDIRMVGSGGVDLSLHKTHDNGTWAKIKFMFMSQELDTVVNHYFDKDGVMMMIDSKAVNESLLRCRLRFEKEAGALNAVSYDRIHHYKIGQVMLRQDFKETFAKEAALLAKRKVEGSPERQQWKALDRTQRIAIRNFHNPTGIGGTSLAERTRYFDPKGSLGQQLRAHAQECSMDELVQENLERFAGRQLLLESMPADSPLATCLESATQRLDPVYLLSDF